MPPKPSPTSALRRRRAFIEEEEGATSRYRGWLAHARRRRCSSACRCSTCTRRSTSCRRRCCGRCTSASMLLLVFLLFPIATRFRNRLMWWDVVCAALGVATIAYLLAGGDDFWDRNTLPNRADVFFGVAFVLLVLEACRRTSGWIMLFVIALFLAYALRRPVAAGAVGASRLRRRRACRASCTRRSKASSAPRSTCRRRSSSCSRSTARSCSSPAPASSSSTGASPRWAASTAGAGRTVVLASFLLGGPSGSGVATTVTIGSVAYPMLERAGYGKDAAGGLLAAGGLGRDHLAAGARRRRVPDRRVPEDQLSRRAPDGDDPDAASTTCRCS